MLATILSVVTPITCIGVTTLIIELTALRMEELRTHIITTSRTTALNMPILSISEIKNQLRNQERGIRELKNPLRTSQGFQMASGLFMPEDHLKNNCHRVMVPVTGVEPARVLTRLDLNQVRLPNPPHRHHHSTSMLVRSEGFEPSRPYRHSALNAARLPFRHDRIPSIRRSGDGAGGEIRTLMGSLPSRPERGVATVSPRPHHRLIDPSIGA